MNEPNIQKYNMDEDIIRELKRRLKQRIVRRWVPKQVGDFGFVWEGKILSRLCRNDSTVSGIERITEDTIDISERLEFEFHYLCWYWDVPNVEDNPKLGWWLGVLYRVGTAMCYWILTSNGTIISRTTVQHLTEDEVCNPDIMQEIQVFHTNLDNILRELQYFCNDAEFTSYLNEGVPELIEGIYPPSLKQREELYCYQLQELEKLKK